MRLWVVVDGSGMFNDAYVFTSEAEADEVMERLSTDKSLDTGQTALSMDSVSFAAIMDLNLEHKYGSSMLHFPRMYEIQAPVVIDEYVPIDAPEDE